MSRYTGRHRKPVPPRGRQRAAALAVAVVAAPAGLVLAEGSASADILDDIRACESTGDYRATNGSHFGGYQFDLKTWQSVGGTGNPMNASPAEQDKRAAMLFAARGTQPWNASRTCWSGKSGKAPKSWKHAAAKPVKVKAAKPQAVKAPKHMAVVPSHTGDGYVVVLGDTLSEIATAKHVSGGWQALYDHNRAEVGANPNLIFPGEKLDL